MRPLRLPIWVVLLSILAMFGAGAAQTPQAVIVVEAWSPQELHDLGWTTHPSTGLKVVGVEEQVYLLVKENAGQEITSVTWSFGSVPTGSTVALDSTNTLRTTFKPDLEGQFVVNVEITTAGGTANSSVTITSAKYVGVGTVGGATPNIAQGQCGICHSGNTQTWSETGHATMFEEAIDGLKSSHYNEACIECHTVGFFEDAANGGFWDVANQLGWQFPDTLQPGNWDDIVANFPELAAVSNIQCENCHGPGSQHKGDVSKIDISLDEGVCGRCHEEEPYHRKNTQWNRSGHSSTALASYAARTGCADCHSGWGFIAKIDPASNLTQKTGFPQISCAVCHDPHSGRQGEHQIRDQDDVTLGDGTVITKGGKGKLCMNCHIGRRDAVEYAQQFQSHFGPHYSNQADMLFGANVITWGMYVPSSTHRDALADACVSCHMFATPAAGQPGRDEIGEHTFAMSANGVDNVAACARCHGEDLESFEDIIAREDYDRDGAIESCIAELHGMMERVGNLLPPDGPTVEVTPSYNKLQLNAAFNYFFVEDDASNGMHNFQFAINLLKLTETALTYGVLVEGEILEVADIPNDQGKQVRVAWTRFGGDGVSDNPVKNYGIWRRVDEPAAGNSVNSATLTNLNLSAAQIAGLDVGTALQLGNTKWDFVGSVPAATLDNYSAVVPTLFDSTIVGGLKWSVFMVSGHTEIPAVYAMTEPDSGYSIDNLAPAAPANVSGLERLNSIFLKWDASLDKDFNYFTIYRSTTSGFDPKSVEPLAQLTENSYQDSDVAIGTTYYYRVSAFDFSGNESAYSSEFSLLVTSVEGSGGELPKEYALHQNYPNPFNPTTVINFDLKESGHTVVKVYNMLGEEVMTLVDGHLEAGPHRVMVSASDLNSGIYFYKIRVNGFTAVKKMIVMK